MLKGREGPYTSYSRKFYPNPYHHHHHWLPLASPHSAIYRIGKVLLSRALGAVGGHTVPIAETTAVRVRLSGAIIIVGGSVLLVAVAFAIGTPDVYL